MRLYTIERKSIKEVFDIRNGYTPSKSNNEYWENGTIPWFKMEDLREKGNILSKANQYVNKKGIKGKEFPENSIILATSATIGEHALITEKFLANQRFTCFMLKDEFKQNFSIKFIYYFFFKIDEWCKKNMKISNFPSVDVEQIKELKFPLPPLPVQEHIVNILDKFETLVNDVKEGLPQEIEQRQKQYEYFREKLLTFPKE